jgi:hypothetical protein
MRRNFTACSLHMILLKCLNREGRGHVARTERARNVDYTTFLLQRLTGKGNLEDIWGRYKEMCMMVWIGFSWFTVETGVGLL